jgi:ABC transporter
VRRPIPSPAGAFERGQVLAVLGPNGAGKTTFVRTVATLVRPDEGTLRVAGHDVRRHPGAVRQVIGLAGQFAAVEPAMIGRENLDMIARLFGQDGRSATVAARSMLEQLGLLDDADRLARTYSTCSLGGIAIGMPTVLDRRIASNPSSSCIRRAVAPVPRTHQPSRADRRKQRAGSFGREERRGAPRLVGQQQRRSSYVERATRTKVRCQSLLLTSPGDPGPPVWSVLGLGRALRAARASYVRLGQDAQRAARSAHRAAPDSPRTAGPEDGSEGRQIYQLGPRSPVSLAEDRRKTAFTPRPGARAN